MARVHLTFDNGPHPEGTPRVLDALGERGLRATFFVLGKHLATDAGRALAEAVRDAGHRLGNHSWSHETPLGEDPRPDAVERELEATQRLLDEVWRGPRWFRPFGGGGQLGPHLLSPAAVEWHARRGASCVLWNSVPGDWLDADAWVDRALEDAARYDHVVVVLHDFFPEPMRRLPAFLDALGKDGHVLTDALPEACVPIDRGTPRPGLEAFVGDPAAARDDADPPGP